MLPRLNLIIGLVRNNLLLWTGMSLGIVSGYYLLLMLSLMSRFGHLPN